jgi:ferredoxin
MTNVININIRINNKSMAVKGGTTLMEAAIAAGHTIPAMCHNGTVEHFTSCMICLVKDNLSGALIPSCSMPVAEGMDITTDNEEITTARKTAIELLLSDHLGDCEAPCRMACPAKMDISQMNRLIAEGRDEEALACVMEDIALPGVMGRICPAPCEAACKRAAIDEPVAICLLKRFAADHAKHPPVVKQEKETGKRVAIIGAGAAGLSAAFYLRKRGIAVELFDRRTMPGGAMRYEIPDEVLDKSVLDQEIETIRDMGATFHPNREINQGVFETLRREFDAVIIATGGAPEEMHRLGLVSDGEHFNIDKKSYRTPLEGVYAVGLQPQKNRMAIRAAAQGKDVARIIDLHFQGDPAPSTPRRFNSLLGKLHQPEFAEYLKLGSDQPRQSVSRPEGNGFTQSEARTEAGRCFHCDCRKPDHCLLRIYAEEYGASQRRFRYGERKEVQKIVRPGMVVYEPGKCIKCGLCVRITAQQGEAYGFTFIGKGFDVHIGIPFNAELNKALEKSVVIVCESCPTGALALLQEEERIKR